MSTERELAMQALHKIRNDFAVIIGFAEMVADGKETACKELVERVLEVAPRMQEGLSVIQKYAEKCGDCS